MEQCENYSHNGESLCLSIFDHDTESKIKYYVACVFVSVLDVKCKRKQQIMIKMNLMWSLRIN